MFVFIATNQGMEWHCKVSGLLSSAQFSRSCKCCSNNALLLMWVCAEHISITMPDNTILTVSILCLVASIEISYWWGTFEVWNVRSSIVAVCKLFDLCLQKWGRTWDTTPERAWYGQSRRKVLDVIRWKIVLDQAFGIVHIIKSIILVYTKLISCISNYLNSERSLKELRILPSIPSKGKSKAHHPSMLQLEKLGDGHIKLWNICHNNQILPLMTKTAKYNSPKISNWLASTTSKVHSCAPMYPPPHWFTQWQSCS